MREKHGQNVCISQVFLKYFHYEILENMLFKKYLCLFILSVQFFSQNVSSRQELSKNFIEVK